MLGAVSNFVSRFGSSKGMVAVPNLLGVNATTANSRLALAGLSVSNFSGSIPTNIPSQDGVALSQQIPPGTLVDYETPIVVSYGQLFADSIVTSGCEGYPGSTTSSGNWCVGTETYFSVTRTKRRKTITRTNNITGDTEITFDYNCLDEVSGGGSRYIDGSCGYVTPRATCTPTANVTDSACNAPFTRTVAGTFTRTTSGVDGNCDPYSSSVSITCYQPMCDPYGPWSTAPFDTNKEQRGQNCQTADGTFYQNREVRCKTTYVVTYGGCGSNGRKIKVTKKYVCGKWQSTSTASIPCNVI
jgi:hypothetical protein